MRPSTLTSKHLDYIAERITGAKQLALDDGSIVEAYGILPSGVFLTSAIQTASRGVMVIDLIKNVIPRGYGDDAFDGVPATFTPQDFRTFQTEALAKYNFTIKDEHVLVPRVDVYGKASYLSLTVALDGDEIVYYSVRPRKLIANYCFEPKQSVSWQADYLNMIAFHTVYNPDTNYYNWAVRTHNELSQQHPSHNLLPPLTKREIRNRMTAAETGKQTPTLKKIDTTLFYPQSRVVSIPKKVLVSPGFKVIENWLQNQDAESSASTDEKFLHAPMATPSNVKVKTIRSAIRAVYPKAPRPDMDTAIDAYLAKNTPKVEKVKLGSMSMSGLLDSAKSFIKTHHPKLHQFADAATHAVKSHVSTVATATIAKVAAAVERKLDNSPAERLGRDYGLSIAHPFTASPTVVPDIKLYRTGSLKCPTETTANTAQGTGSDTSHQSGGALLNAVAQSVGVLPAFVNGLPTSINYYPDTVSTFLAANSLSQRQVSAGIRVRNTTSSLNRQGRFVVLRAPFSQLGTLNLMTFGQLCALNFAHVGDFADQESFAFRWVPAGTSDLAFIAPAASPASDNTMVYWRCSCAAAQTIEVDTICNYEYRAIVANEVGLPVVVSIGSEDAAARALDSAVKSGLLDDTKDPLKGLAIKTWAGGAHASSVRDVVGLQSLPPRAVLPMQDQPSMLKLSNWMNDMRKRPYLWNATDQELIDAYGPDGPSYLVPGDKKTEFGDPVNQTTEQNDMLKNASFAALGVVAPYALPILEAVDFLAGASSGGTVVGYNADRLLCFAASITSDAIIELIRAIKQGLLSADVVAPFVELASLAVEIGPYGLNYTVGDKKYEFRLQATERDLYGRLVRQPRLVAILPGMCPNCPPEFECHAATSCKEARQKFEEISPLPEFQVQLKRDALRRARQQGEESFQLVKR